MRLTKPQTILFEYDNYRIYLKDLYQELKAQKGAFSFRYFSQRAGFKSPNFLKLVIEGKRNLSADSIEKCSFVFKHNKQEADYFRNLVLLNQAQTVEERKFYAQQLLKFSHFRKAHPLSPAQFDYYSKWYLIPLREMVGAPFFKEDPEWIAKTLNPPITPAEAKKALETLSTLQLIERDASGSLKQTNQVVSTGDDVSHSFVSNWHREMIYKGSEAIDRFKSQEREISSVTLGLSAQGALKAREMIRQFRRELLALACQEQSIEGVFQVNFQLFALTQLFSKESQS